MAKIQYSDSAVITGNSDNNRVGFFTLKNDCEEAVVRIMQDSVESFEILTTHPVTVNGKYRRVNCIRNPYEQMDKCPLCATDTKIETKIYIRLVEYTNDNGNIIASPKVWERSISYANTLKSYLDNYGPLSDMVCKIVRHGAPGDMKTTYEIIPNLSKNVFPDNVYVKHSELFDGYSALGTAVMDKNFDELNEFVLTGQFPNKGNTTPVTQNTTTQQSNTQYTPQYVQETVAQPQATPQTAYQNYGNTVPTPQAVQGNPQPQAVRYVESQKFGSVPNIDRPVRYN